MTCISEPFYIYINTIFLYNKTTNYEQPLIHAFFWRSTASGLAEKVGELSGLREQLGHKNIPVGWVILVSLLC